MECFVKYTRGLVLKRARKATAFPRKEKICFFDLAKKARYTFTLGIWWWLFQDLIGLVSTASYCKCPSVQVVHKVKKLEWIAKFLQFYRPRQPSGITLQVKQALNPVHLCFKETQPKVWAWHPPISQDSSLLGKMKMRKPREIAAAITLLSVQGHPMS